MDEKDSKSKKWRSVGSKDKVAHGLLYLGLGMSLLSICAAHVYHDIRRAYEKIKKRNNHREKKEK